MLDSTPTDPTSTPGQPSPEKLPHWLRLSNLPFSSRLLTSLLDCFDHDPEALFDAFDAELDEVPGFQAKHLFHLRKPVYAATNRQIR